jgi:hypothetical protein
MDEHRIGNVDCAILLHFGNLYSMGSQSSHLGFWWNFDIRLWDPISSCKHTKTFGNICRKSCKKTLLQGFWVGRPDNYNQQSRNSQDKKKNITLPVDFTFALQFTIKIMCQLYQGVMRLSQKICQIVALRPQVIFDVLGRSASGPIGPPLFHFYSILF